MKNAVRRLDGNSVKKEETAHNISAKPEKSETSSEAEEPKPVIQKFLHEGKPVVPLRARGAGLARRAWAEQIDHRERSLHVAGASALDPIDV